ncbi:MAG: hypothetical protein WCQ62_13055, partial [Sphaerochaeta sp.]
MKKTIAILLVLVIGMVGVFAADAILSLSTTIPVVDQIVITQDDDFDITTTNANLTTDGSYSLPAAWDNTGTTKT